LRRNVRATATRLELLHELLPSVTTMALLVNPAVPALAEPVSRTSQAAAHALGLQLHVVHARSERDFDAIFENLIQLHAGALVIGADNLFSTHSKQLAALTVRHALPAIYGFRQFAAAGGLMSYGSSENGILPSGRHLRWKSSQGRQAGRLAGPAVDESRADHQSQDRPRARHYCAAPADRPRRRGDRMTATMKRRELITLHISAQCTRERLSSSSSKAT